MIAGRESRRRSHVCILIELCVRRGHALPLRLSRGDPRLSAEGKASRDVWTFSLLMRQKGEDICLFTETLPVFLYEIMSV